jgi:hypothetical protein
VALEVVSVASPELVTELRPVPVSLPDDVLVLVALPVRVRVVVAAVVVPSAPCNTSTIPSTAFVQLSSSVTIINSTIADTFPPQSLAIECASSATSLAHELNLDV